MDNIYLKKISREDNLYYDYYKMAMLWDKKRECFLSKNDDGLFGLFECVYLMYLNDDIIGYGILNIIPEFRTSKIDYRLTYSKINYYLTYIIKPEYRKKGYGKILLHLLEETAKRDFNANDVIVEILKKNIPSITLIENSDYEFEYFDDKKIVFKKELK